MYVEVTGHEGSEDEAHALLKRVGKRDDPDPNFLVSRLASQ
jgi:hypothetical protein